MNDIIIKVARRGEGKTRDLLAIAHDYSKNYKVCFLATNTKEFSRFCEKYFVVYHETCPVWIIEDNTSIDNSTVVLIDNLFSHILTTEDLRELQQKCYKLFITIEGTTKDDVPEVENKYEQLTFWDM